LGVPWEGDPPSHAEPARIRALPAARWEGDWPRGCTSDDTQQVMLASRYLADHGANATARGFLTLLADNAASIRGIGPTTQAALDQFRATGELPVSAPSGRRGTNGAAMRMLPVGLAVPSGRPDLRRRLVRDLAATHVDEESIAAACVMAAMGSRAVEAVGLETVLNTARDETVWALRHFSGADGLREVLAALEGEWAPPAGGVSLAAGETMAAVVHVLRSCDGLSDGLVRSVQLGGDTDTVAALVGGVLGALDPDGATRLEWWHLVRFEEDGDVDTIAARIAALRTDLYAL
jgi:ADP-ribosyl-[dinitrogen reductase] hydrolase